LHFLETKGIQVDHAGLQVQQNKISRYMENLEMRIFQMAGSEFNLNSPEQVARVLYQQLNMLSNFFEVKKSAKMPKGSPGRKRLLKTLSTSKLALIKLQEVSDNNLPTLIMEWRRLNHAYYQSAVPIRNALHFEHQPRGSSGKHSRNPCVDTACAYIYCHCDEWSVTGRISMHEPNLINIDKDFQVTSITEAMARHLDRDESSPSSSESSSDATVTSAAVGTPITIRLRQHICSREHYILVSADYCQLELRILSNFTQDPCLLSTLNNPENDVFKSIAAAWKNISIENVTYEVRQQAKQVFNILQCF
jgi:DNA polymerase theta